MRIERKIPFIMVAVALLSVLSFGATGLLLVKHHYAQVLETSGKEKLTLQQQQVQKELQVLEQSTQAIATNPTVMDAARDYRETWPAMEGLLSEEKKTLGYEDIIVLDKSGVVVASTNINILAGSPWSQQEVWQERLQKQANSLGFYREAGGKQYLLQPLAKVGSVIFILPQNYWQDLLQKALGENAHTVAITEGSGHMLAGDMPEESKFTQPIRFANQDWKIISAEVLSADRSLIKLSKDIAVLGVAIFAITGFFGLLLSKYLVQEAKQERVTPSLSQKSRSIEANSYLEQVAETSKRIKIWALNALLEVSRDVTVEKNKVKSLHRLKDMAMAIHNDAASLKKEL